MAALALRAWPCGYGADAPAYVQPQPHGRGAPRKCRRMEHGPRGPDSPHLVIGFMQAEVGSRGSLVP